MFCILSELSWHDACTFFKQTCTHNFGETRFRYESVLRSNVMNNFSRLLQMFKTQEWEGRELLLSYNWHTHHWSEIMRHFVCKQAVTGYDESLMFLLNVPRYHIKTFFYPFILYKLTAHAVDNVIKHFYNLITVRSLISHKLELIVLYITVCSSIFFDDSCFNSIQLYQIKPYFYRSTCHLKILILNI